MRHVASCDLSLVLMFSPLAVSSGKISLPRRRDARAIAEPYPPASPTARFAQWVVTALNGAKGVSIQPYPYITEQALCLFGCGVDTMSCDKHCGFANLMELLKIIEDCCCPFPKCRRCRLSFIDNIFGDEFANRLYRDVLQRVVGARELAKQGRLTIFQLGLHGIVQEHAERLLEDRAQWLSVHRDITGHRI
jgi:hypothetical protein